MGCLFSHVTQVRARYPKSQTPSQMPIFSPTPAKAGRLTRTRRHACARNQTKNEAATAAVSEPLRNSLSTRNWIWRCSGCFSASLSFVPLTGWAGKRKNHGNSGVIKGCHWCIHAIVLVAEKQSKNDGRYATTRGVGGGGGGGETLEPTANDAAAQGGGARW